MLLNFILFLWILLVIDLTSSVFIISCRFFCWLAIDMIRFCYSYSNIKAALVILKKHESIKMEEYERNYVSIIR